MRKQPGEATLSQEEMTRTLEESGNYRLLCKLSQRQIVPAKRRGFSQVGVIIDRETTGLNHKAD